MDGLDSRFRLSARRTRRDALVPLPHHCQGRLAQHSAKAGIRAAASGSGKHLAAWFFGGRNLAPAAADPSPVSGVPGRAHRDFRLLFHRFRGCAENVSGCAGDLLPVGSEFHRAPLSAPLRPAIGRHRGIGFLAEFPESNPCAGGSRDGDQWQDVRKVLPYPRPNPTGTAVAQVDAADRGTERRACVAVPAAGRCRRAYRGHREHEVRPDGVR